MHSSAPIRQRFRRYRGALLLLKNKILINGIRFRKPEFSLNGLEIKNLQKFSKCTSFTTGVIEEIFFILLP